MILAFHTPLQQQIHYIFNLWRKVILHNNDPIQKSTLLKRWNDAGALKTLIVPISVGTGRRAENSCRLEKYDPMIIDALNSHRTVAFVE